MTTKKTLSRRDICKMGLIATVALPLNAHAQPANRKRPQRGDQIVFDVGDMAGQLIGLDQLVLNAQPIAALARDPETKEVRDGSRLNRLMVMRVDPATLSAQTLNNAAEGIIAYSAICTHTGCDITNWKSDELHMACPCHESEFDVRDNGNVVGGPAPRPLAMLPLVIEDGELRVAGAFKGRVGFQQQF
jgi:rieske iron-sulfur protein